MKQLLALAAAAWSLQAQPIADEKLYLDFFLQLAVVSRVMPAEQLPAELNRQRAELDRTVLEGRDKLRKALGEDSFRKLDAFARGGLSLQNQREAG